MTPTAIWWLNCDSCLIISFSFSSFLSVSLQTNPYHLHQPHHTDPTRSFQFHTLHRSIWYCDNHHVPTTHPNVFLRSLGEAESKLLSTHHDERLHCMRPHERGSTHGRGDMSKVCRRTECTACSQCFWRLHGYHSWLEALLYHHIVTQSFADASNQPGDAVSSRHSWGLASFRFL